VNDFYENIGIIASYMAWIAPIIIFIVITIGLYGEEIKEWIFEFFESLIPEKYIEYCMECNKIYECNPRFITILKMRKCHKKDKREVE